MTTLSSGPGDVPPMSTDSPAWPTMVDVARAAGTSLKTVSRVVNAEPGVREATAQRVQDAIVRLGFRRNDGASLLRRGASTSSIGLVLEDLAGPFYATVSAAVERTARTHGYLMLTSAAESDSVQAARSVIAFTARRVDGLIIALSHTDASELDQALPSGLATVFADRPSSRSDADSVLTDNEGGVAAAVRHLVGLGHRQIAFLGDDERIWTAQRRRDGFAQAMSAHGLQAAGLIAMGPHDATTLAALVPRWLAGPQPVTAAVTGNNRCTFALVRFLRHQPALALSYVGFDDFDLADLLEPAVTTVAQDSDQVGRRAAELLFDRIAHPGAAARRVVVPAHLVVRDSARPAP